MNMNLKRIIFWTPRILGILFAVFISLFAVDVLGEGYGIGEAILGFLIHLVPTYLVIITLVIAWRKEWIGAILFIALGLVYIILAWGEFPWGTYLVISGPLILIGILFLVSGFYKTEIRTS